MVVLSVFHHITVFIRALAPLEVVSVRACACLCACVYTCVVYVFVCEYDFYAADVTALFSEHFEQAFAFINTGLKDGTCPNVCFHISVSIVYSLLI